MYSSYYSSPSSQSLANPMPMLRLVIAFSFFVIIALDSPAAVLAFDNETEEVFERYIETHSIGYNEKAVYGLGPEFAVGVMRFARLSFALHLESEYATPIEFVPKELDLIKCRVDGFFDHCEHPFAGNTAFTDAVPPFHVDFVIDDEPFVSENSPEVQNFPLFVLGVGPIFNIPGITRLVLDHETLAHIFRGCDPGEDVQCLPGSITRWNDTAIKATNPPSTHAHLDAAGEIKVVIESLSSSNTAAFRRALSSFDSTFATQVGPGRTNEWNGTNHLQVPGPHAVIKKVQETPGSISYTKINLNNERSHVNFAELLNVNGHAVKPNTDSLYTAFQEIGLAFGNDGSDPELHNIDLTGALGARAWPIAAIGYLAFRPEDESEYCESKRESLLAFLEYIYQHEGYGSEIFVDGLAPMTPQASLEVLELVRDQLKCGTTRIYESSPQPQLVTIEAEESLHETMRMIGDQFTRNRSIDIQVAAPESHLTIKKRFVCLGNTSCTDYAGGLTVLADENLSTYIIRDDEADDRYELFSMPYCAMATGLIYNFCEVGETHCPYSYHEPLVLDLEVSARILDQSILFWNDSMIQALNPDKQLPDEEILVIAGPRSSSFHFDFVDVIRRTYLPSFSFSGGGSGTRTYYEAWLDVGLTPFSVSFVPFNGTVVENVQKVSLVSRQGEVVSPSTRAIEACARDTYDPDSNLFFMSSSEEPDCWPLVQVFNLFMRKQVRYPTNAFFTQYLYRRAYRDDQVSEDSDEAAYEDVTILNAAELGTLSDLRLEGRDLAHENFLRLETITDLDGNFVLLIPHNLNLIPSGLIIAMYVLLAMELVAYFGLAVWVIVHRNRKLIRNSSPVFMVQVLIGASMMACTVIPLARQDDYLYPRGMTEAELAKQNPSLDSACVSQPIIFSLGFFITFSALFLKSWRLIRIFNNKKLRNLFLRDRQLLIYQLVVMVIVVILNLVWALRDPLVWRRFAVFIDSEEGMVVASIGLCYSRGGVYPALPLLIGIMLVLAIGNYLAYLGRRIPTEFNESKWTAMAMVVTLEAVAIGLPILALANSQPVPGFIIKAFCSLLIPGATVGLIFVPKVAMAYGWGVSDADSNPWRFVKGDSGSGSNGSKRSHKDAAGVAGTNDTSMSKGVKASISPSLNALMDGKVLVINTSEKVGSQSQNPVFASLSRNSSKSKNGFSTPPPSPRSGGSPPNRDSKRLSKELAGSSPTQALTKVLQDDPMRRRFRRYLQTLKMEENVRFWDSIAMFRTESDAHRRYVSARAIVQTFVLDSSPLQVNLSSKTKQEIVRAYNDNDKLFLGSLDFFNAASDELFEDLRQSDAFRSFLENDTFSQQDAFTNSKSDPVVVPIMDGVPN